MSYKFELITGAMSSGKTEELLRRLKRAQIAKKQFKVFSPVIDTRTNGLCIQSRNGNWINATKVETGYEIMNKTSAKDKIIAIDEIQFLDKSIIQLIYFCFELNIKVIATGLELDFKGEPFGHMGELLCLADKVDKLTAICVKCGSDYACRTQRLINGKPASKSSQIIMIDDEKVTYEARCIDCWEI